MKRILLTLMFGLTCLSCMDDLSVTKITHMKRFEVRNGKTAFYGHVEMTALRSLLSARRVYFNAGYDSSYPTRTWHPYYFWRYLENISAFNYATLSTFNDAWTYIMTNLSVSQVSTVIYNNFSNSGKTLLTPLFALTENGFNNYKIVRASLIARGANLDTVNLGDYSNDNYIATSVMFNIDNNYSLSLDIVAWAETLYTTLDGTYNGYLTTKQFTDLARTFAYLDKMVQNRSLYPWSSPVQSLLSNDTIEQIVSNVSYTTGLLTLKLILTDLKSVIDIRSTKKLNVQPNQYYAPLSSKYYCNVIQNPIGSDVVTNAYAFACINFDQPFTIDYVRRTESSRNRKADLNWALLSAHDDQMYTSASQLDDDSNPVFMFPRRIFDLPEISQSVVKLRIPARIELLIISHTSQENPSVTFFGSHYFKYDGKFHYNDIRGSLVKADINAFPNSPIAHGGDILFGFAFDVAYAPSVVCNGSHPASLISFIPDVKCIEAVGVLSPKPLYEH